MASPTAGEKTTHLHFYMHDAYGGENPTAMKIVSGPTTDGPGPRHFGDVVAFDNKVTAGPDAAASALVGRAQGFAVRTSAGGKVSELNMTVVMEEGEYRGSSVTILGRVDLSLPVREIPVVGGTGQFRLARGYAFTQSSDYDLATGGTVEIDVHLVHN
ncbi:dirigent protein 2 [Canna indica]|uniref:Dirigent protein n=1 Tax=Canna indica TaxID=4628 RepID=A0AAQ3KPZ3_9LILI|nr:dirigent protein 2 [Canna indica]